METIKKDRYISELLNVMLDNQDWFYNGLCDWIHDLFKENIINKKEENILYEFIKNNPPINKLLFSGYYWEKHKIEPRIEWIKQHIEKLKTNETKT